MTPERHRYRFPRTRRLRRQADFDRVFRGNVYAADATLVVQGARTTAGQGRLGISVSRRVGNAVVRNRWKRTVREAYRQQPHRMPSDLDLVVRPRRGAVLSFQAVWQSLPQLARRVERQLKRGGA